MSSKLALVVDDSRMARYVLSKMLTEQGIEVESVESGEEALGYLCGKKPSMIFMDHTMPGMDGFQCLRAIKNDPHTAMIPIIMYTSKEGEVYESQARALGAADVLPKTLKPLMLAKVLERQNLLPNQSGVVDMDSVPAANDVVIVENDTDDDLEPVLHNKTADNAELEALQSRIETLTEQLNSMGQADKEPQRRNWLNFIPYLGLALCLLMIIWLLQKNSQLEQNLENVRSEKQQLSDNLGQQSQQSKAIKTEIVAEKDNQAEQNALHSRRFFESIEWALNEEGQFAWDEKPFNDRLASTLAQLGENLESVDFIGEIGVRSHLGRFCLETLSTGEPSLPEPEKTLSSCEITQFNGDLGESVGTAQTSAFERFLAAFQAQYGDDIVITLSTASDRRPLSRYPRPEPDMLAERWNKVAARNQRIEISINPD